METNTNGVYSNEIDFAKVPITALRQRARSILSRSLNPGKVLLSEEGFPRDWRGIAHLAELQSLYVPVINAESDPMTKVLNLWCSESTKEKANFYNLVKFLGIIDRWDVADDLSEVLAEDAEAYKSKKYQNHLLVAARQENAVGVQELHVTVAHHNPDENVLTRDDVDRARQGLPPQTYDAFVLYADEDIGFATELIDRLEEDVPRFGFKLCVKDRDLIGGISFEHEAIMRLISERCNRLIVIVSAAFLKSSANSFFVNFAQAIQTEQRRRIIVPCLYEHCVLPQSLSIYFQLRYHQSGRLFNFWEKLSDSIRTTKVLANGNAVQGTAPPSIQIEEITDSPTQRAAIEAAPIATAPPISDAPVKLPRTKGTKIPVADRAKVHSKPEPKARNVFTMIQLNAQTPSDANFSGQSLSAANCDISQSESNLSEISSTKSSRNKPKWYKKLLSSGNSAEANPPATLTPSAKSCESITKPKTKRSWLKKKVISSTT